MARAIQLPDRSPLIRQPLLLSVISLRRCYRKGKVGVRRPGGASSLGRGAFQLAGEGFSFGVQNETGPFWGGPTWKCPRKGLGGTGEIHGTNTGLRSAAESYNYVAIGPHLSERDGRGEADPGPPPPF